MDVGRGRIPALLFLTIVLLAIAALLAGYGVPVGVGALVGFALGSMAGAMGALWLARGSGRSMHLGGYAWSSYDTAVTPSAELAAEMHELTEVLAVDIGSIQSIVPVLSTVEADGLEVQLLAIEIHEAGASIGFDVHVRPGGLPLLPVVNVSVTDDLGTAYRALGQMQGGGPGRLRYEVMVIPAVPNAARDLSVQIDGFIDPFQGGRRTQIGPWAFEVALPADVG